MFITQCNISCIFLFSLPTVSFIDVIHATEKRSRSTHTKKMKKNIKEIKKNRKKKPWAATTICSKFTFFSVLLPDKALIKTAMCSVKLVLVLVTSFLHTYIHTMALQFQHIHINMQIYTAMCSLFEKYSKTCRSNIHGEASERVHACLYGFN